MSRPLAVLLVLLLAAPTALVGQPAAPTGPLQPGARVRITQPGETPRVAILVALTADSLVVQGPEFANDETLSLGEITRLEVSTGRHRNVLKGMALGVGVGGTAGLLLGAIGYQECTGMCIMAPSDRGESAAIGGVLLGTLGLVIGTLAGLPSHDTWQRVPLDRKNFTVGVTQRALGPGLGITLRF